MENLNKESKPYKSGEYEEMFNAAEIASMAAEDIALVLRHDDPMIQLCTHPSTFD